MKKFVQLTLLGMMIVSLSVNAQQDAKSFVQQYKNQDGFTVITIGKPAIRMASLFVRASADKDAAQALKYVEALQILTFNRGWDNSHAEKFNSEALKFFDTNQFEEMIEVVEPDNTVKILCKIESETITDMIILNRSKRDTSVDMVCIKGRFKLEDIHSMSSNFGVKVAGM